ncbi:Pentatricopeptide repeat-containing protein At3g24000, mitochondrial [Linum perenne]
MYSKSCSIGESKLVFDRMVGKNVITWTSMVTAYSQNHRPYEAMVLAREMMECGLRLNSVTFLAVLSACSHAGFVDKGLKYFDLLKKNGSSLGAPRLEHYASVVDIFGRAGYLKEAAEFIRNMPVKPGPSVYKALLSACLVHGDLETAELSARKLLDLSPDDSAAYVMLFNMLKRSDHWNDAEALQRLICYRGLKKMPGYSWF